MNACKKYYKTNKKHTIQFKNKKTTILVYQWNSNEILEIIYEFITELKFITFIMNYFFACFHDCFVKLSKDS